MRIKDKYEKLVKQYSSEYKILENIDLNDLRIGLEVLYIHVSSEYRYDAIEGIITFIGDRDITVTYNKKCYRSKKENFINRLIKIGV